MLFRVFLRAGKQRDFLGDLQMVKGEALKRIIFMFAAFGLLLLFSGGTARADELSDLKQQMEDMTKTLQQMQERIAQLESRQKLKERSLDEKIEAVSKKTEEIEKAAPSGLPESLSWIERIKWSGDFRYRHEHIDEETVGSVRWKNGRDRDRIRARLMLEAIVNNEWGLAFRIVSGSADPTSTNQTLDNSFSSKDIWLDLAFFDYHPEKVKGLNVYGGKVKNPFYRVGGNQLIFDSDLNPEGLAFALERPLNERDKLRMVGSGFWVDEGPGEETDPALFGAQLMVTHPIGNPDTLIAGVSYYDFSAIKGYGSLPATWGGAGFLGNSNSNGRYTNDYNVLEVFGEYATKYDGTPLRLFGNWIRNVNATSHKDTGWLVGTKYNKAIAPGSWEASYTYRDLEADATVGAFSDSDFIGGGTNGKGSVFGFNYQLFKNVQAALTYFLNEDRANTAGRSFDYHRLQADLVLKFK
jgi:hypothetical protein